MRSQTVLFALVTVLAMFGPWEAESAGVAERAGPQMEIPWPEWWADMPPPGPLHVPVPLPQPEAPKAHVRPTAALLDMLMSWLTANFGLQASAGHPRVELVPRVNLATLRYRGLLSDRSPQHPGGDASAGPFGDLQAVHAVYDDDKHIIYLPEDWEGETPVEISVLVHELVHHLQNVARLKFSCPQERESIAYQAQTHWLELFGKNLGDELGIDPFDILVRTRCFN